MADQMRDSEGVALDPFLSPKQGSAEILLVRHADALPGPDEVIEGGYDAQPLSELERRGEDLRRADHQVHIGPGRCRNAPGRDQQR